VQVDVEIEHPAKALHDDDGAAATIRNAGGACAAPEEHRDIL
jgi:hypothetical protein